MTLDQLFNSAKTQDAGFEEGHISHRKDGDYIKQGGSWKPYTGGQKKDGAGKAAGTDEQTMRQSLINFMTKGAPHVPEADAKKAVEGLPGDTLNEMFENLKQQHGDKYLAKNEDTLKASIIEGMTPEQKQAVMEGKTYRRVKEGEGVVDITKADLEAAPEKSKDDAYMDEHGLHDIYMDIKNNELEDYTVEEIAKEYRITKGDAEVIKNRIENNKRAKEQDKQDRKDQAAAGSTGSATSSGEGVKINSDNVEIDGVTIPKNKIVYGGINPIVPIAVMEITSGPDKGSRILGSPNIREARKYYEKNGSNYNVHKEQLDAAEIYMSVEGDEEAENWFFNNYKTQLAEAAKKGTGSSNDAAPLTGDTKIRVRK